MKISLRILLINFIVVASIFISSTIVFYSLTKKLISLQHTKSLLNSTNDFVFELQSTLQQIDESYLKYKTKPGVKDSIPNLDFIFELESDSLINRTTAFFNPGITGQNDFTSIRQFKYYYPISIIRKEIKNGVIICYGKIINEVTLNVISKKIRAEIAVMQNDVPFEISNAEQNENYFYSIIEANKSLHQKNYEIFQEEKDEADFYATSFSTKDFHIADYNVNFLIFSKLPETAELRSNINKLLIIIGFAGVALSLILTMIFSDKIRKQIIHLSKTAEKIKEGDHSQRVSILTKDELGQLGLTFNGMINEIEKNEISKNEYSEFITLIHQNPTLDEVADAALNKIISTTGFIAGQLSVIEYGKINLIKTYGLNNELRSSFTQNYDLYQRVVDKAEIVEFHFSENHPQLSSGILSIKIEYLIVLPIVYNKTVIAILELVSISKPKSDVKVFLDNIKEQLAVGLTNAMALRQLENLVKELKVLNDDYQKQNDKISEQNKKLIELHQELSNKAQELETQKSKAVESEIIKSQFLANMSHELKTPLNSVIGLTELMLNDPITSTSNKERLSIILRNGNRLVKLINDILNFSKLEAGKMEIYKEDFCLDELLNDIDVQISPLLRNKEINFIMQNGVDGELILNTDLNKLQQIVVNLLSNAVKFTEKGIIKLKVEMPEDEKLIIEVQDTGIGISQQDINLIFEEFRQVDGSASRKYNGTGLGLAISKKFAEFLNGELTCESKPGDGAIFRLAIPVKVVGKKDEKIAVNQAEQKSIIILEEESLNQSFVANLLKTKSYKPVLVNNSLTSDELNRINPFCLIANINTYREKWEQFIQLLKQRQNYPLITYYVSADSNIWYDLPLTDFIIKPVDSKKLTYIVNKYEHLSERRIENIFYIDEDSYSFKELKTETQNDKFYFTIGSDEQTIPDLLLQVKPDLILLSLSSQEIDGFSLLSKIKDIQSIRSLPVIGMISDEMSKEDINKFYFRVNNEAMQSKSTVFNSLKRIRNRLNFEEGKISDDVSAIRIDTVFDKQVTENVLEHINNKKNTIMIVDDDVDTLYTLTEIIRKENHNILSARNGVECLSKLRTTLPDIILLDIMMPQMDGFETIRRIRSDIKFKNIPVFALTAQSMFNEREILTKNGFDGFIPKPVDGANLLQKINSLIFNGEAK